MDIKDKSLNKKTAVNVVLFIMFALLAFLVANKIYVLAFLATMVLMIISIQANLLISLSVTILGIAITYIVGGQVETIKMALLYYLPGFLSGILIASSKIRRIYIIKSKDFKDIDLKQDRFASISSFLISILIFATSIAAYYIVMKYVYNDDIVKTLQSMVDKIIGVYRENASAIEIKRIEDTGIMGTFGNIGSVFAVIIFTKAIFYSVLCYFVALRLSNVIYSNKIESVSMDNFILPGRPVFVMLAAVLVLFLIGYSNPNYNTQYIISNFIAVMNILFFLQGISIFIYIIKNWSNTKKAVNWILFIAVVVILGIAPGISFIGMLDNMVNYRARWLAVKK